MKLAVYGEMQESNDIDQLISCVRIHNDGTGWAAEEVTFDTGKPIVELIDGSAIDSFAEFWENSLNDEFSAVLISEANFEAAQDSSPDFIEQLREQDAIDFLDEPAFWPKEESEITA